MIAWKRIGVALLFVPAIVYAQQGIFEPIYPMLRAIVELLGFKWLNETAQPYALKTILFIMYAVLINYGLQKAKFDRKVSVTIAISISAIGIIFMPERLSGRIIGSQYGNIAGLVGLLLPAGITMYFLYHNTAGFSPRMRAWSRLFIYLFSAVILSSAVTYLELSEGPILSLISMISVFFIIMSIGYLVVAVNRRDDGTLTTPQNNYAPSSDDIKIVIGDIKKIIPSFRKASRSERTLFSELQPVFDEISKKLRDVIIKKQKKIDADISKEKAQLRVKIESLREKMTAVIYLYNQKNNVLRRTINDLLKLEKELEERISAGEQNSVVIKDLEKIKELIKAINDEYPAERDYTQLLNDTINKYVESVNNLIRDLEDFERRKEVINDIDITKNLRTYIGELISHLNDIEKIDEQIALATEKLQEIK